MEELLTIFKIARRKFIMLFTQLSDKFSVSAKVWDRASAKGGMSGKVCEIIDGAMSAEAFHSYHR